MVESYLVAFFLIRGEKQQQQQNIEFYSFILVGNVLTYHRMYGVLVFHDQIKLGSYGL